MALKQKTRGRTPPDTPEAIRAAMAKTRAALTEKLEALQERVLGMGKPAPNQGVQAMAKKRTATGAAKRGGAKRGAKAKSRGKKAAASASRRTAGRKAAAKRAAGTRKAGKAAKGGAKKVVTRKKKSTVSKVMDRVRDAAADVLAAAGAGAVHGAAAAVATQATQTSQKAEHAIPPTPTTPMSPTEPAHTGSSYTTSWPQ